MFSNLVVATSAGSHVSGFLSGAASSIQSGIGEAMPIIGGVFATIAGIGVAVKLFSRITGARGA